MWNPFKRKHLVPMVRHTHLYDIMADRYLDSPQTHPMTIQFYDWIEQEYGIKRKYNWNTQKNYLVFDSEQHYTWFLLQL